MKRRILAIPLAAVVMAVGAAPALADRGAPGTTFPEQPGTVPGCAAVTTNPGTGPGGQGFIHLSDTAFGIVTGLVRDACFEP